MQINIPKVTRFLPLQEYDASMAGVGIQIWVDPPQAVLVEFDELNRSYRRVMDVLVKKLGIDIGPKEKGAYHAGANLAPLRWMVLWIQAKAKGSADERFKSETETYRHAIYGWYSRLWSQSPDLATHFTVEEVEQLNDKNPHFYEWLTSSSWAMIEAHRAEIKKGYRGRSVNLQVAEGPATPS